MALSLYEDALHPVIGRDLLNEKFFFFWVFGTNPVYYSISIITVFSLADVSVGVVKHRIRGRQLWIYYPLCFAGLGLFLATMAFSAKPWE